MNSVAAPQLGICYPRFPRARGLALGLGRAAAPRLSAQLWGLYSAIPQGSRTRPGLRSCRRSAAQSASSLWGTVSGLVLYLSLLRSSGFVIRGFPGLADSPWA